MIPWVHIDAAEIPGGEGTLRLKRRGAEFSIMLGDNELMNSRLSGSEQALATLCCERLADRPAPKFLIGGLGMGFTLRAALEKLGPKAEVVVAELVPAVIAWARGPMAEVFAGSLDDPRARIREADVGAVIAEARGAWDAILLDVDERSIAYRKPGLQVDLGGIAKGFAVDRGIALLRTHGIQSAVISAGGDSRILGDLGDRPRTIGIRHPRRQDEFVVLIPLADTAISTSGDYERFFMKDGVRFHHILDPGTGRSAQGVQSASVLAAHAIDSDALSTTVFVLGVAAGLELVNRLPGVDAIIIDGDGKLHYSADLLLNTTP